RIDGAISARTQSGLPHGRAYVERLDRDRAANKRGYATLDFPMTAREARYFEDRSRVEQEANRVGQFVDRSPRLSGGISIEDDYPRGAHVRLRVTRRLRRSESR